MGDRKFTNTIIVTPASRNANSFHFTVPNAVIRINHSMIYIVHWQFVFLITHILIYHILIEYSVQHKIPEETIHETEKK